MDLKPEIKRFSKYSNLMLKSLNFKNSYYILRTCSDIENRVLLAETYTQSTQRNSLWILLSVICIHTTCFKTKPFASRFGVLRDFVTME